MKHPTKLIGIAAAAMTIVSAANASPIRKVTVTVQNLAPTNSVATSDLSFAFHTGTYDPFDAGSSATAALVPVAELGSGAVWLPSFAAGDPKAVTGTAAGILTPGQTSSSGQLPIDVGTDQYFSFGAMVVPSNDHFIGNDDPKAFRIFDDSGKLLINHIDLVAADIWDAGSEVYDPANAAFVAGSDATRRIAENGVIRHDFAEFTRFDGLTTAAGYTFNSNLSGTTPIYRISFTAGAVPEPASWAMMLAGFGGIGAAMRRRRRVVAFA